MDELALKFAERLVPPSYVSQGGEAMRARRNKVRQLLEQRKCPKEGWDDLTIELLLNDLASMDSNNFSHNCGVGEREGRVYSELVRRRHYRLAHGVGRSGDLAENQPKAAGSSLMYTLTNAIVLDLIRHMGVQKAAACLVVPMATGMSLTLCLLTLRPTRPQAKFVIWPRIDQKSCFKSIITAGFIPEIIENKLEAGGELRTDLAELERRVEKLGAENIAAIMTTTSCFAPRGIDRLEEVAGVCERRNIPHIINNAYGLQSSKCLHHIQQAARVGRVDAFVQSTDKNLMVPVGGSIVAGFDAKFIAQVSKTYPGRASNSPILDVFITLLSMGTEGYAKLSAQRKELKVHMTEGLQEVAHKHGLQVIESKNNPISVVKVNIEVLVPLSLHIALTLPHGASDHNLTQLGSMLFRRGVSGTRVVTATDNKTIAGHQFIGWGSHCNNYPYPYLTAAAGIGMENEDMKLFLERLGKCLGKTVVEGKLVQGGKEKKDIGKEEEKDNVFSEAEEKENGFSEEEEGRK
ncbi:hypothetical protein Pmani_007726 [Petrolisthes manimaculis]|uniref:O-phosphoseryl-tRNA(Sec) selenium transferase n=1 Tax=Petrolisthes manimaculis TaxID=1843537 RepID=A0AAE1Q7Q2_9EUCA|nr:hypothetical protein Pmani_007726 [Petrolisthes manimaculis]